MSLSPYIDRVTLLSHGFVIGLVRDFNKLYDSTELYGSMNLCGRWFVTSWQNMRLLLLKSIIFRLYL